MTLSSVSIFYFGGILTSVFLLINILIRSLISLLDIIPFPSLSNYFTNLSKCTPHMCFFWDSLKFSSIKVLISSLSNSALPSESYFAQIASTIVLISKFDYNPKLVRVGFTGDLEDGDLSSGILVKLNLNPVLFLLSKVLLLFDYCSNSSVNFLS